MKSSVKLSAVLLSLILIGSVEPVFAQANFYEGKTIRFIVGFSAGGGYDTYTRLIARHMGKYVPGNPVFVVDNMAGAGSMISANYTYTRSPNRTGSPSATLSVASSCSSSWPSPASSSTRLSSSTSAYRRKITSYLVSPNPPVSPTLRNGSHPSRSSSLAA